jgi:hypothetical protein
MIMADAVLVPEGSNSELVIAIIEQKPQDLPVEGAENIDLAVNLETADLFDLAVLRKILLRPDAFRR